MYNKVFLSVHNDDEVLFGAYTIMRERPLVIVVYDSYVQVTRGDPNCHRAARIGETQNALLEMGQDLQQLRLCGLRDDCHYTHSEVIGSILSVLPVSAWETVTDVWAPAYEEGGHDQHNLVAQSVNSLANHRYTTYTRGKGKTRTSHLVTPTPDMIALKHRALACYTSQIANPSTRLWFRGDIEEYYEK